MKKTKSFIFETPKIIGILSDKKVSDNLQKKVTHILKKRRLPYVCLPFIVDTRHLKNVISCMKIMDIDGLIITGKHVKNILKFLPKIAATARKEKRVTAISRRKNSFFGDYLPPDSLDKIVDLLTSRL